ncbi:expressed unknown protein [Seminavis robusta]|uniref:Uncharacterized protein n=1 Tax=Seminavis robusta TaxID=568900 RepID=A0A9N8HJR5_9STRA|nr:expressed unknown protein [Seminavis robusta]|eukprot:Sro880_g215020.1 n/a (491) ;mRNA; f:18637-20109
MSEDRHAFSEPRAIVGLPLPTWDVDVFRDGVPEPILTLRVDETTLPPRRSKKKKIVWKLPDSLDQIPRFGADEKRRLLDLFKNLKKEKRRKSKRGSLTGDALTESGGEETNEDWTASTNSTNGKNNEQDEEEEDVIAKPKNGNHAMTNGHNKEKPSPPPVKNPPDLVDEKPLPPPPNQKQKQQLQPPQKFTSKPPPGMTLTRRNSAPLPPGIPPPAAAQQGTTNGVHAPVSRGRLLPTTAWNWNVRAQSMPLEDTEPPQSTPPQAKQKQLPQQQEPPPPPSIQPQNGHSHNHHHHIPPSQPPQPSRPSQPPQEIPQSHSLSPPGGPAINPSAVLPSIQPLALPPARFLKFPTTTMSPDLFAQQVANLYISLLQSGQVEELLLYYTLTAQKSLSLKSAKSMCHTPSEMKIQLTSLVGCAFAVQGITVQQGAMNSLLLIWSGICQLAGQQHGFCQTIILMPLLPVVDTTNGSDHSNIQYQIQNDALVLLTND